jgi:hypothetical protein
MLTLKTTRAQTPSDLQAWGAACRRSIWEEEVREILGKHVGGRGGERVRTIHRHLIIDAVGDSLEVDLVVGRHHAESLLDA